MTAAAWSNSPSETLSDIRRVGLSYHILHTALYCVLGAISLCTAYIQMNTASVWIPSGFAIGLLLARGNGAWPAITVGSFLLNLGLNILQDGMVIPADIAVALSICLGNTMEALVGAGLARRLANGGNFLSSTRRLVMFAAVVAPVAAVCSTAIGIATSWLAGITPSGAINEAALTWYIANVVGAHIFAGPTVVILTGNLRLPGRDRWPEALALFLCLLFASQSISGIYLIDTFDGWLKAYMILPPLMWASFRFGAHGALFAVVLLVLISVIGSVRGFQLFFAETPSRSLIYLQIYLAMLSIMAQMIAASQAEAAQLHANLDARVRERTAEVERLLQEKSVFTTVVAHDLQSPLYGLRSALRATADALDQGRLDVRDVTSAMNVMEETCTTLANRVAVLLAPQTDDERQAQNLKPARIADLVDTIIAAHSAEARSRKTGISFSGDRQLAVERSGEVEHLLDILIENAIHHTPPGSTVEIEAFQNGPTIEVVVSDDGDGIAPDLIPLLFSRRDRQQAGDGALRGMGLHLANELAAGCSGRLTYSSNVPHGSRFRLVLPESSVRQVDLTL